MSEPNMVGEGQARTHLKLEAKVTRLADLAGRA
jgi:hypothetical protein